MLLNTFKTREVHFEPIIPKVTLLKPFEREQNGVLVKGSEFQVVDIADELSKFKSSDFDIANLMAVGSFGNLTTTYMSSMSDMNVADKFDNFKFDLPNTK